MSDRFTHQSIDDRVTARENWAYRRRRGIPNNKKLFVLTCMDERVPIEQTLGLELGDAHIFRNAGGIVTDDAIRSAALTTHFFQTVEIIVVQHTDCGMMIRTNEQLESGFNENLAAHGLTLDQIQLDPALPDLNVPSDSRADWIGAFSDVDASVLRAIQLLEEHPLIPDTIKIHGYVYEVESGELRRPNAIPAAQVSTSP